MNAIRRAFTEADPDLQVVGGGGGGGDKRAGEEGGGHTDREIRRGPGLQKHFLALRASVWSKNKGGRGPSPPGPYPGPAAGLGNLITGVLTYDQVILRQS